MKSLISPLCEKNEKKNVKTRSRGYINMEMQRAGPHDAWSDDKKSGMKYALFVFKIMNFALKVMNFAFNLLLISASWRPGRRYMVRLRTQIMDLVPNNHGFILKIMGLVPRKSWICSKDDRFHTEKWRICTENCQISHWKLLDCCVLTWQRGCSFPVRLCAMESATDTHRSEKSKTNSNKIERFFNEILPLINWDSLIE